MKNKKLINIFLLLWLLILFISFVIGIYLQKNNSIKNENMEQIDKKQWSEIILAGGCFWCIEWAFDEFEGVKSATSWYIWGSAWTANYSDVSSGTTEHREAVKVIYDNTKVTLETILERFFVYIDPFDEWWQFADRWYQYTTAIYYEDDEELHQIEDFIESMNFDKPIATSIEEKSEFFEAEEYHQDYAKKSPFRYWLYFKWSWRKDYVQDNK